MARNTFTMEAPLDTTPGPGIGGRLEARHPNIFGKAYFDPDALGAEKVAPELENAFREVLRDRLAEGTWKVRVDPFLKRVCLYQLANLKTKEGVLVGKHWQRAMLFSGNYTPHSPLPKDLQALNDDGAYDDWAGSIGDWYMPTKEDIKRLFDLADNKQKAKGRGQRHTQKERERQAAARRAIDNFTRGWLDYIWNHEYRKAVQEEGSMQNPFSFRSQEDCHKEALELGLTKYIEVKTPAGYTLKVPRLPDPRDGMLKRMGPDGLIHQLAGELPAQAANLSQTEAPQLDPENAPKDYIPVVQETRAKRKLLAIDLEKV